MERPVSGVLFSYYSKSQYHERCVPQQPVHTEPEQTAGKKGPEPINGIKADLQWKHAVETEQTAVKTWERNWGFLAEFDAKGNPKERKTLPERMSVFSEKVPQTNGQNYGARLATDNGQKIQQMEKIFYGARKKKKMDKEMAISAV